MQNKISQAGNPVVVFIISAVLVVMMAAAIIPQSFWVSLSMQLFK